MPPHLSFQQCTGAHGLMVSFLQLIQDNRYVNHLHWPRHSRSLVDKGAMCKKCKAVTLPKDWRAIYSKVGQKLASIFLGICNNYVCHFVWNIFLRAVLATI